MMRRCLTVVIAVALAAAMGLGLAWAVEGKRQGSAKRGWQVFLNKRCIACHLIGTGGKAIGPDLVRSAANLTAGGLAAAMWNHAPQMWEKMAEHRFDFSQISGQEAVDLFAFFAFLRYIEEEGNPKEGEKVLARKGCTACHSVKGRGGGMAPDITSWGRYVNPIQWVQKMWTHAPQMEKAMQKRGLAWPTFSGHEMIDVIAYIRGLASCEERMHLAPGDPRRGERLFSSKGCAGCHAIGGRGGQGGPDLGRRDLNLPTIGRLAGLMWNHAPAMTRMMRAKGVPREPISPGELADIIAYLFDAQLKDEPGNKAAGREVFSRKHCRTCHVGDASTRVGPDLATQKGKVTIPWMAQVMWNHGPQMWEEMKNRGLEWPNLDGKELVDLIAHLNDKP